MEVTKEYIQANLLNKNNVVAATACKRLGITVPIEELYLIYTGTCRPTCGCGNLTSYKGFKKGFAKFCSARCISSNNEVKAKISATNDSKYGGHPLKNNVIKAKVAATNIKKYGGSSPMASKTVRDKHKAVIKCKYGIDNISQDENIKNKKIQTSLRNNGTEYPAQSKEILDKMKKTTLARYGKEYAAQTKEFREAVRETVRAKYGVHNIGQNAKIKKDIRRSHVLAGSWVPVESMSDYEIYKRQVWKETNKHKNSLPNYKLRGRANISKDAYHIDHNFSIYEGFKNNILPNIIGGIKNLSMINCIENIKKGSKCSVLLENIV